MLKTKAGAIIGGSPEVRVLKRPAVQNKTGLSKTHIYVLIAEGKFPKPVHLGGRAVGWVDDDVQAWLDGQILASRKVAEQSVPNARD